MKAIKSIIIGALVALVGFTAGAAYDSTADLTMCVGDVLEIYETHGNNYNLTATSDKESVVTAAKAAESVKSGKFFTLTAVGVGTAKVTLTAARVNTSGNKMVFNITVNAARTVEVNGTANVAGWANDAEPGNTTWTSSVSPSGAVSVSFTQQSDSAMAATLTGKTACDATVTLSNVKNGNVGFKYIYAVRVGSGGDAPSSALTRTVSANGGWTDSAWSDGKTGGQAWTSGADAEITVSGTVTLDVGTGAVSAGAVTLKGTGDLTLRNYQNLTAGSINLSGLDGTVTYLYVSDSANKSSGLQSKITSESDQKVKYGFAGTTAGNGWNIGSWTSSTTLKTHLVLESGTHSITWSGNDKTTAFAQNGTDENPTVLVRNGATLNFTAHDLSGYQSTFAAGGVIRVNAGGTLNIIENTGGQYHNFNYRQRLVLDPESLTTFRFRSGYLFTLHGAGDTPGTATAATANIYVPPSDGTKGPAVLKRAEDGVTGLCINHTGSSRGGGCAIYVGENSKLQLDADVQKGEENDGTNKRILAKLGPGELEITGEVTSSVDFDARAGIITLPSKQDKFKKSFTATADVTYRFPVDWPAETAYTLGSGTVSGTAPAADTATVYVGDETLTGATLVYSGKTVKYALPAKPRTKIAVPTAATGLVWGITNQVGVAAGEGYVRGGTYEASAVGEYTATVTPDDDHCWTDGKRDTRTIKWSIARRPATVTVLPATKAPNDPEPYFHTENVGFLAADQAELEWTAWRTNANEAVGTYDIVIFGEKEQSGYDITYVGNTLTIENAPIGPSISEDEGEITYDPTTKEVVVTPKDETVTEVEIIDMPTDGTVKVPVSIGTIRGVEPSQVTEVFYTAPAGAGGKTYDITLAFTISGDKASGVTVALDETASVMFDLGEGKSETITVTPTLTETGDEVVEPFEVATDEVDVGVKTIPGLMYGLKRSAEPGTVRSGTTVDEKQAEGLRTKLTDPMDGGKPEKAFYIIEVKK